MAMPDAPETRVVPDGLSFNGNRCIQQGEGMLGLVISRVAVSMDPCLAGYAPIWIF